MDTPEEIKVGPFRWAVRALGPSDSHYWELKGRSELAAHTVYLNDHVLGVDRALTLLHEVIHAYRSQYGLELGDEVEEEKLVEGMALCVTQVFGDNEEFFEWFGEELFGARVE